MKHYIHFGETTLKVDGVPFTCDLVFKNARYKLGESYTKYNEDGEAEQHHLTTSMEFPPKSE